MQVVGVCVFLVLAVLAVFEQTAHFEFVGYDDQLNVFRNPVVMKGLSAKAVGWAFTHPQVSNWIPLTTLSHMLDCQLFGLQAGRHHLVNVLWHAANAVLLFLALRQMTGSLWRSAFVAALFAVHPLRAESVAWVSERKDVLSGFFFMLTIGAYVRHVSNPSHAGYVAMALLFALGLMAKSMVATLPFVLLLLDYWPLGRLHNARQFLDLVLEKIPFFAIAAAGCVVTALTPGLLGPCRLPLLQRIGNALISYVVYLRQMIFPVGLAAHYPMESNGQPVWLICLAFALLAAISAVLVVWRKKCPYLLMGWLWYLGMLFPVIGIIQISGDAAYADRYTYLPEIGLAIAVVWGVGDWCGAWKPRPVVLGVLMTAVIGTLTVWGYIQTSYWRNDELLWTRSLACTRGNDFNSMAHNGLGNALYKRGKKKQAIAQYRKALQINPMYKLAQYNLGMALFDEGEREEAVAHYRMALKIDPDYAEVHFSLGNALFAMGGMEEAIAHYRKVLEINPDYPDDRYDLANALLQSGKLEEAVREYRRALETTPSDARVLNNLGIALATKGESNGAIAQFRKALEKDPAFVDAHYDLGVALVKAGKIDEAIVQYRKALEINPDCVKARFGLGKALLRKGDFDGAMNCFQKTASLNMDPLTRWLDLGSDLLQQGNLEEAIDCFRQAIRIAPGSAEAYTRLGLAFFKNGQTKEAIDSWQQALNIQPDQINARKNLAWVLATTPDASLRNGADAVALAEQANQLSGGDNPIVLRTLAAAYAEAGRFGDAAATARRAFELAVSQRNGGLATKLQEEIKLYEADTPMRDVPR